MRDNSFKIIAKDSGCVLVTQRKGRRSRTYRWCKSEGEALAVAKRWRRRAGAAETAGPRLTTFLLGI